MNRVFHRVSRQEHAMTPDPRPPRDDYDGDERREHERHATDASAQLSLLGHTVDGTLRDIGAGGVCFVTADAHIQVTPGNFVEIAFECLLGGERSRLQKSVRVMWQAEEEGDGEAVRAFGLEFEEVMALEGFAPIGAER
jgi:PilZ domain-containing protein